MSSTLCGAIGALATQNPRLFREIENKTSDRRWSRSRTHHDCDAVGGWSALPTVSVCLTLKCKSKRPAGVLIAIADAGTGFNPAPPTVFFDPLFTSVGHNSRRRKFPRKDRLHDLVAERYPFDAIEQGRN
jgi:hypothetical protein